MLSSKFVLVRMSTWTQRVRSNLWFAWIYFVHTSGPEQSSLCGTSRNPGFWLRPFENQNRCPWREGWVSLFCNWTSIRDRTCSSYYLSTPPGSAVTSLAVRSTACLDWGGNASFLEEAVIFCIIMGFFFPYGDISRRWSMAKILF